MDRKDRKWRAKMNTDPINNQSNTDKKDLEVAQARTERDAAEIQAAAEALQRREVEAQRNRAIDVAMDRTAQSDAAAAAAAVEASRRREAEERAMAASMAANQANFDAAQLATERNVLRANLEQERRVAANSSFGLALIASIAVAVLICIGIYYFATTNHCASQRSPRSTRGLQCSYVYASHCRPASGDHQQPTARDAYATEHRPYRPGG
jgi:hypothetical protein